MSDVPANQLFDAYFTAAPMRAVFSDRGRLQGMLDFEAALARAEARTGVVPATAVAPIEAACRAELYDPLALAEAVATAGNSAIPLVKALGRQVAAGDAEAERYVHLGATSQDAMDWSRPCSRRCRRNTSAASVSGTPSGKPCRNSVAWLPARCNRRSACSKAWRWTPSGCAATLA